MIDEEIMAMPMQYNTIAEIPGTDKKDEIVMLGGHLDSWTSATGATDNAIGCAIMLEAARILETLDVPAYSISNPTCVGRIRRREPLVARWQQLRGRSDRAVPRA